MDCTVLKELRKLRGVSQVKMAQDLSMTVSYLSMIENGKKDPSLGALEKMCKYLDCDIKIVIA